MVRNVQTAVSLLLLFSGSRGGSQTTRCIPLMTNLWPGYMGHAVSAIVPAVVTSNSPWVLPSCSLYAEILNFTPVASFFRSRTYLLYFRVSREISKKRDCIACNKLLVSIYHLCQVMSPDDTTQIGKVAKQWSGVFREWITDADTFAISCNARLFARSDYYIIALIPR